MESGTNIRLPAVSGAFYPDNNQEITSMLDVFFNNTKKVSNQRLKALILPHAGWVYSGQTAAWGYAQLPKSNQEQHFLIIGPSHNHAFSGLVGSSADSWKTPLGQVKQVQPLRKEAQITIDETIHTQEHCLEVQIPFLQYLYTNFSITCFLVGQKIEYKKAAEKIVSAFPNSYILISSDLSHYLSNDEAEKKDQKTINAITSFNTDYLLNENNVACGAVGISLLLTVADIKNWKPKLIFYETSASATGNKTEVVGYTAIGFYE